MGATSLVGFSSISFFNSFTNCAVTGQTSLGGDGSFRQRTGSENWPAIVGKAAARVYTILYLTPRHMTELSLYAICMVLAH